MSKKLKTIIASTLILFAFPMSQLAVSLSDIEGHWAESAILKMVERGAILGYPDGTFLPEKEVSKLDTWLMASRILGCNDEENKEVAQEAVDEYGDLLKEYISYGIDEIAYLLETGVLETSSEEYSDLIKNPSQIATRGDATIIFTKVLGKEDEVKDISETLDFADVDEIDSDLLGYVEYVYSEGIIEGIPNGNGEVEMQAEKSLTRAEMATLLLRVDEKIEENEAYENAETVYVEGTVSSTDLEGQTISVLANDDVEEYEITSDIPITLDGETITFADIQVNQSIIIEMKLNKILSIVLSGGAENPDTEEQEKQEENSGITVVPTMQDTITDDSSWCGTFQLVWNDMKNEVVKKDIVFDPQEEMAENLNKEEFTEDMISDEYIYKTYGLKTLELKEKIENGIKEKFDQESDVLDDIDWSEDALNDPDNPEVDRYLFYAMLYRKFEFPKVFDKLENGEFGDKYDDVKYFGIDSSTSDKVRNQVDVLYYNSEDDFAIILNTKTNDEVILCKNPEGNTFKEIYDNMNEKAESYTGSTYFKDVDELKVPYLEFDEKREYTELENKQFETADGAIGNIVKAIQTIKFSLDEKGGEIKSEAVIDGEKATAAKPEDPRYFYVDDTFAIFLREEGQDLPYFAGRIDDITKFQ